MAWDDDRPYAPFYLGEGSRPNPDRTRLERLEYERRTGDMVEHVDTNPGKDDIDAMYAGAHVPAWTYDRWRDYETDYAFRPFREVRLKLRLAGFSPRRSAGTFMFEDEHGRAYPMTAGEFNRLCEDGVLSSEIDGFWSAVKRGRTYGVTLVRLAREEP
jgi:hypothetical protein